MDQSTLSCKRQFQSQIDSLPDELVIDILSRLPFLHLFQSCTLVSKAWCHLANLAFSQTDHFAHAIIENEPQEDKLVFSLHLDCFLDQPLNIVAPHSNIIDNIITRSLDDEHFVFYHFCNGFYLLGYSRLPRSTPIHTMFPNISESSYTYSMEFCVANALTFMKASLPPLPVTVPKDSKEFDCFLEYEWNFWLAFDPRVSPYYKVILQAEPYQHPSQLLLFSSETWKWREVEMSWNTPLPDNVGAVTLGGINRTVCTKGSAWCVCDIWSAGIDRNVVNRGLLRLDVEEESFELITSLPCKCDKGDEFAHYCHDVWEYRGTSKEPYLLQLVCRDDFNCVGIWGLRRKKNGGKPSYSYSWDLMYQVPWQIDLSRIWPSFINPPTAVACDGDAFTVEVRNALSSMSSKEMQLLRGLCSLDENVLIKVISFLCLNDPSAAH